MNTFLIYFMNALFVANVIGLFSIWVTPINLKNIYLTEIIRYRGR